MKTIVSIEWNEPKEQTWLCADNIQVALSKYCKNTKFKVKEIENKKITFEKWCSLSEINNKIYALYLSGVNDIKIKNLYKEYLKENNY